MSDDEDDDDFDIDHILEESNEFSLKVVDLFNTTKEDGGSKVFGLVSAVIQIQIQSSRRISPEIAHRLLTGNLYEMVLSTAETIQGQIEEWSRQELEKC